jgi:hypothetical protein
MNPENPRQEISSLGEDVINQFSSLEQLADEIDDLQNGDNAEKIAEIIGTIKPLKKFEDYVRDSQHAGIDPEQRISQAKSEDIEAYDTLILEFNNRIASPPTISSSELHVFFKKAERLIRGI